MSHPTHDDIMMPVRRFRAAAVRASLIATVILGAGAYGLAGRVAAHGVLLGGIAGVLGFWFMARRLEKFATIRPEKVHSAALTGTLLRLLIYGVVMYRAYTLDTENLRGLIGAVAGLLVIRFVAVFMGLTGMAMPEIPASDTGDAGEDADGGPDAPRD